MAYTYIYGSQRTLSVNGASAKFKPFIGYAVSTNNTSVSVDLQFGFRVNKVSYPGSMDPSSNPFNITVSNTIGNENPHRVSVVFGRTGDYVTRATIRTYTRTHATQSIYIRCAQMGSAESDYAKYYLSVPARPSYTFSYNAGGGTGAPPSQTKWYDEALTLSSAKPTRSGYTFLRWSGSDGNPYEPGKTVKLDINRNLTLTAQWEVNKVNITFNNNNGYQEGSSYRLPYTQVYTYNNNIDLFDIETFKLKKAGYHTDPNVAWNRNANGTGTSYSQTTKYPWTTFGNLNSGITNTTLYANWKPNNYTIKFDRNSNYADGTISNMQMTYNVAKRLSGQSFTRTGYTQDGWSLTPSGDKRYSLDQTITNLTSTKDGTFTLYAHWEADATSFRIGDNSICQRATYGYIKTSDIEIDPLKTYYIQVTVEDEAVYQQVENPVVEDIGTYYEYTYFPSDDGEYGLIQLDIIAGSYFDEQAEPTGEWKELNPYKIDIEIKEQNTSPIVWSTSVYDCSGIVSIITAQPIINQTKDYDIKITATSNPSLDFSRTVIREDMISKAYFIIDVNANGTAIGMFQAAPDEQEGLFLDKNVYINGKDVLAGPKETIITRTKTYNINKAGGTVAISADNVTGYTFVCWLQPATHGWVGYPYIVNPSSSPSNVWQASNTGQTGTGSVLVTALYRANY